MKRLRIYTASALASLFAFMGVMTVAAPASALFESSKGQAQCGVNLEDPTGANSSCVDSTNSSSKVSDTLKIVLNIISIVAGVVAIIMVVIGGLRFITSQGEGSSTALARNTVIYAVVGVVVVLSAQGLIFFVINRVVDPPATPATPPIGTCIPPRC